MTEPLPLQQQHTVEEYTIMDRIDKGLELYYSSFPNVTYKNANEKMGKFRAYCSENFDSEDEAVEDEIQQETAEDCTLLDFDVIEDDDGNEINNFPFHTPIDDEDERNKEIFRIIKYIYNNEGEPPNTINCIDKGLNEYYACFPSATYMNSENIGKFKAFCINKRYNEEQVRNEMNVAKAEDCKLLAFDEDDDGNNQFPLFNHIDDEKERDNDIFRIMRYCYDHGQPEPNDLPPFIPTPTPPATNNKLNYFHHTLDKIEPSKRVHFKAKATFMNTFKGKDLTSKRGLRLNEKKSVKLKIEQKSPEKQHHMIEIEINDQLKELIGISQHNKNSLFRNDLISLLIDSYHRYCIFTDIMEDKDDQKSNVIRYKEQEQYVYGQVYWKQRLRRNAIEKRKYISNNIELLQKKYKEKLQENNCTVILFVNGEDRDETEEKKNNDIEELTKSVLDDYTDIVFKFMSSNAFYWSLVRHKDLKFFKAAFKNYDEQICGPLTLKDVPKMNDNIFVFWMYIWSMSNVIKQYMQSGNVTLPLQVDMVIIPNDNIDKQIDNISVRFNSHNQKFESGLCDSGNIDSIQHRLGTIFMKCSIKMKKKESRIVIVIDRRSRKEYFYDKHCDRIFAYKPSSKGKYARIDKKHQTINAIWNTSQYVIPPPPNYSGRSELIGAKNHNLFVLTYFVREKEQFDKLFDYDEDEDVDALSVQTGTTLQTQTTTASNFDFPLQFTHPKAKDISSKLRKHGRNITSMELTEMVVEVQQQMNEEIKTGLTAHNRAKTVNNLYGGINELQELQRYLVEAALNRKKEAVVNTYLFYNKGYCRFEPLDLIHILPKFFNIKTQSNYDQIIKEFQTFHQKLWELDDEIWMKYKTIYLKLPNGMDQKVIVEELGTDPKDRQKMNNYCLWKKDNEMKYDENDKVISITLNIEIDNFLSWKSNPSGYGMRIIEIKNNNVHNIEFGKDELWSVIAINNTNISNMRETEIKDEFKKIDMKNEEEYKLKLIGGIFTMIPTNIPIIGLEERIIGLTIELNTFLQWNKKQKPDKNGIKITQIDNIGNGVAFKETGILKGWYINAVNDANIGNMEPDKFQTFLEEEINPNAKHGYKIRFVYPDDNLSATNVKKLKKTQTNK